MSPVDGGGRMRSTAPPAIGIWKCPSCGAENQGPIYAGCTSCGAGKPGQPAKQAPRPSDPVGEAFQSWLGGLRDTIEPATALLLFDAFKAGYAMGLGEQKPEVLADTPLSGTPESRTIIAALELFVDNVLQHSPEEVKSGEFLSAAETRKLIERLRRDV